MRNIEKQLELIWDFQETFQHSQTDSLFIGTAKGRTFRLNLFLEELQEFQEAIEENDNLEKLDATLDMLYILGGSIQYHGLGSTFNAFLTGETDYVNTTIENYPNLINKVLHSFSERYLSAKTKLSFSEILNFYLELVVLVLSLYDKLQSQGIVKNDRFDDAFLEVHSSNMSKLDKHGKPIFRKSDGKIMKGPFYYKPNLKQFLV